MHRKFDNHKKYLREEEGRFLCADQTHLLSFSKNGCHTLFSRIDYGWRNL